MPYARQKIQQNHFFNNCPRGKIPLKNHVSFKILRICEIKFKKCKKKYLRMQQICNEMRNKKTL